jgi:hypothetical protein
VSQPEGHYFKTRRLASVLTALRWRGLRRKKKIVRVIDHTA